MREKREQKGEPDQALRKNMQETGARKPQKRRENETRKNKQTGKPSFHPSQFPFVRHVSQSKPAFGPVTGASLYRRAPFVIARRKGAVVTQKNVGDAFQEPSIL
jgi:hypothetical protein